MSLQAKQIAQQRLMLAPNITLALEVLRMPTLELRAFLEHQLVENPLLEMDEPDEGDSATPSDETNGKEESQEANLDEDWLSHWGTASEREESDPNNDREDRIVDQRLVTGQSLHDSLRLQLGCQIASDEVLRLGEVIITNLNDDGYIDASLEELASHAQVSVEQIEASLQVIQRFDPPGVGARDLRECLMIQLEHNNARHTLAYRILQDHFQLFAQRTVSAIAKATGASAIEVASAFDCLKRLNPNPGRVFVGELPPSIIPDLVIHQRETHYDVELNDQEMPRISVSRTYYRMLKDPRTPGDAKEFLVGKFRQASWLIKAIDERNTTILSIARCLISLQRDFLEQGPQALKPLTQSQVAHLVGRHASTVSRAITGKTIDTPFGVLYLEQFFASGVPQGRPVGSPARSDTSSPPADRSQYPGAASSQTAAAADTRSISNVTIKSELKRLTQEEDPARPLSDAALAKRLAEGNIAVARRTIAKYRTSLKILPAHLRKHRL